MQRCQGAKKNDVYLADFAALRLCVKPDVGKTDRRHRAAQSHRAAGGNGQRLESFFILQSAFCIGFEQSQIIGRIRLNLFDLAANSVFFYN